MSRSQLYAQALEAYVDSESGDEITEQLNRVYSKISSELEPGLERAALEILRNERWK
jgi:flagellin-specific chaperone FliS